MPIPTELAIAQHALFEPGGLTEQDLSHLLEDMLSARVDYADLYFQVQHAESWTLEEGKVKDGSFSIDQGVGVRAIAGEKTGFAYAQDIHREALSHAVDAARSIAQQGRQGHVCAWKVPVKQFTSLYTTDNPLVGCSEADKIDLLRRVDEEARRQHPAVKKVMASLLGLYEIVLILNHEGLMVPDIRPMVRLNVSVIVEKDGRREQGFAGGGGRCGYDFFQTSERALGYARDAVRVALLNLEARPAPAGTMPVVLGPGWPGVLLHEAVGHGLEGDFNRKGTSAFANRMGELVASKQCTVVDDGTLPGRRGSLKVDDEGTPTESTVLIDKGILSGYMQDRLNARLMGSKPTGNGRRESYACIPMPRMTNTYMLPGKYAQEEIIASVDRGLYAVNFSGGQVDITSGKFVFSTSEAYWIEKGKILYPVKEAMLMGHGPEVLTRVSMVGDNLALDTGVGICGKDGQSVPVGVGQPTLKVDAITVGGDKIS